MFQYYNTLQLYQSFAQVGDQKITLRFSSVLFFSLNLFAVAFTKNIFLSSTESSKTTSGVADHLNDGFCEIHSSGQQAVKVLPLFLQRSQVRLQLSLSLLISHKEELSADFQSVDEGALILLEQQLCVLRRGKEEERMRRGIGGFPNLLKPLHSSSMITKGLNKNKKVNPSPGFLLSLHNEVLLKSVHHQNTVEII